MDKFRIRGGDFIGIIVPGIFLLTNLYLLFHFPIKKFLVKLLGSQEFAVQENVIIFIVFIVLSYIVGVFLRLFSPDIPDSHSGYVKICKEIFKEILQENKNSTIISRGIFPYFNWVMESARYNWPNIKDKFDEYLCYLDDTTRARIMLKGKAEINCRSFLNYCKLFVMHHSPALGDEILFAEGMSRMVSGLFYATLFSIIIIIGMIAFNCMMLLIFKHTFHIENYVLLFALNVILLIKIKGGVRHLREKEVLIIFGSYGILKK